MKKTKILVNLKTYQRKWPIDRASVRTYLQKVCKQLGVQDAEVTVVFLNDVQMRCYNKEFRNRDYSTDVLSFPINEILDQRYYLGDILISLQRTASQAEENGYSFHHELKTLLLHGVLHLLGYDHENDSGEMRRLETRLRRSLIG